MGDLFVRRLAPVYALLLVLLAAGAAGAGPSASGSGASARAFAIRVLAPGQSGGGTREVTAPPDSVQFGGGFAYPSDGSAVSTGAVTASATASAGDATAAATATSQVDSLWLFGGEITASQVVGKATASAKSGSANGDVSGGYVSGLVALGQSVGGGRVQLGDWGYLLTMVQGSAPTGDGYRGFVTALEVHLTAEHGGLPAGSSIQVGFAEAVAKAAAPAAPAATTPAVPSRARLAPRLSSEAPLPTRPGGRPLVRRPLPTLTPRLTPGGYVFPVHGPSSFTDTFGAGRAVVGWHHGEDIFAPIGAPVLAVARGTVFSVGWNDIGGNRLWLRDAKGNEFYYAHLSAFSPLAVNGAQVEPGDVLGFVGNSGDAETTPPHLHFEIHPVDLLALGYDGVINPYGWLMAVRRLEDVRFIAGVGWAPGRRSSAPNPGAYLVSSADISTASGLGPGSLRRAMTDTAADGALAEETPPPASDPLAGER